MAKKKKKKAGYPKVVPLYAVGIHQAAASGSLSKMRATAKQAEKHLAQAGNVAAALEALKMEIAKLEAGG